MSQSPARRVIAGMDRCLQVFTGFLVVLLLCVVSAGIVYRAINQPLGWTDEISGFLMVWLACLGWMIATRHGTHIRIRLIQERLPRAAWRAFEVSSQAAVGLVGGVVAWQSVNLMRVNADIEAVSLPLSVAWLYAPLLPAGLLTLVQALIDLRKARPGEGEGEGPSPW